MDVALVVTDLDGTLWHEPSTVHPRTQAAVTKVAAGPVPLLAATGRRVHSTISALDGLGVRPSAVVLNGALGIDLATGERFHQGGFTTDEAVAVLEVFQAHGIDPCIHVDDDLHPVRVSETPSTHPEHLAGFGHHARVCDLVAVVGDDRVLAFGVLGLDERLAQEVGAALEAVATPHVDRDREFRGCSVTAAPRTGSKWDGVAAYCRRHGLDETAVLASGDGPNDVEMLAHAAVAVVPEDGHPRALALADHVVGRAADGGWAELVELLGGGPA